MQGASGRRLNQGSGCAASLHRVGAGHCGKTVLRTGYSISYIEDLSAGRTLMPLNPPFGFSDQMTNSQGLIPSRRLQDGFNPPVIPSLTNLSGLLHITDTNYRTEYAQNWSFGVQETYVSKYEYQNEQGGPWIQNVGLYSGAGPVFRNQYTLSATWSMGPWAAGLVNHYKSGYLDQDLGQSPILRVGAYSTWDLYGSWSPDKAMTLTLGVRNVFDRKPPASIQGARRIWGITGEPIWIRLGTMRLSQ